MKLRLLHFCAGLLLIAAANGAFATENAASAPSSAMEEMAEIEQPCESGYVHDHRRQKGLPSGGSECIKAEDAAMKDADERKEEGHDHRKQHKQNH